MKKSILLILVLANGIAPMSLATEDTWTTRSPMPTATSLHSASVVDGKIYVIGGTDNLLGWADYWSTVLVYDPATDTWTKKADMPTGRARFSTSVVNGKIYAIGGSPHRDAEVAAVEVYEPSTDTWTKKADMPRARNWHSSTVVNGKIYVIGGKIYPSATMVSTVEEYDPATDAWTRKTDMPTARGMHSVGVVDGKIYVIGGITGDLGPWISTTEVYDPATDTWTKKADMPTSKTAHSSSALNGKIYVIGGANNWGSCLSMVEVYDPATDTWAKGLDMPTARGCHSTSVVNGKIYAIGGTLNPSSWRPTSTVEVYDPNPLVVDFNSDGIVDATDMCIMLDHWDENYILCDIYPMPWGDSIIDVQDLFVLAEHMYGYRRPIAHWTLDEAEGNIAYDKVGENDALIYGGAVFQPTEGMFNGALELDGIDDYASADFVLNPADGAFSVFAWIKGGLPGQVILSQIDGVNWLSADPSEGKLMTNLSEPPGGRTPPPPLVSEFAINDGDWHRIGFVWDGAYRALYVDNIRIAEDSQTGLTDSFGGLNIGCGSDLATGTSWSGLIDDVRIYDVALSAEQIAILTQ